MCRARAGRRRLRMTRLLSKSALLRRVITAVQDGGGEVLLLSTEHPFDLLVMDRDLRLLVRLFIWNVTHGGASRAATEYRIQVTGVDRPLAVPDGYSGLLLGWYEDAGVFAAFDASLHQHPGASPSIQISQHTLLRAADEKGIASQRRSREETALAFPPAFLLTYISHHALLHDMADIPADAELLEAASLDEPIETDALSYEREIVVRTVASRKRQADFARRVLRAYDGRCAVCEIDLELVEAAHILPVAQQGSTDETVNGLALCALHHRAYDRSLLGVLPDYSVLVNEERLDELRDAGLAAGEQAFLDGLRPWLRLPRFRPHRPHPPYLEGGLLCRGWLAA